LQSDRDGAGEAGAAERLFRGENHHLVGETEADEPR